MHNFDDDSLSKNVGQFRFVFSLLLPPAPADNVLLLPHSTHFSNRLVTRHPPEKSFEYQTDDDGDAPSYSLRYCNLVPLIPSIFPWCSSFSFSSFLALRDPVPHRHFSISFHPLFLLLLLLLLYFFSYSLYHPAVHHSAVRELFSSTLLSAE